MKKDFILATIFIPVYNQETLVLKALDSLPIRDDIEILVLNDGSTDNTYNNIIQYQKEHPEKPFSFISFEINRGLGAMKNYVYKNAKGIYIGELDSDDYVYTDKYNQVLNQLDGNVDIVYMNLLDNKNDIFELKEETKIGLCGGPCKFIKKSLIGETRCPEVKTPGEDYSFNLEIQKKPHKDKFTGIIAYHYNFPRKGSLYSQLMKEDE